MRATMISTKKSVRSVILIEDDDLLRLSIGRFLALYDLDVKIYASGEEALRAICDDTCDIIITDFNLPGMNGLELVKIMRNRNITTPVILVSAIQGSDFETTALTLGIAAVFTKPLNIEELKEQIDRLI